MHKEQEAHERIGQIITHVGNIFEVHYGKSLVTKCSVCFHSLKSSFN